MNLDEAIEIIKNELWLHKQNGHKEVAADMKGVLAAMEQAKASVAHANTLSEQRLARSMHLEIIYQRYFMANMQTQKGLNRLVKKCQRQKAKIEQLQQALAQHDAGKGGAG